jgi:hypothetical protein
MIEAAPRDAIALKAKKSFDGAKLVVASQSLEETCP